MTLNIDTLLSRHSFYLKSIHTRSLSLNHVIARDKDFPTLKIFLLNNFSPVHEMFMNKRDINTDAQLEPISVSRAGPCSNEICTLIFKADKR